jgi:hypothetical protein
MARAKKATREELDARIFKLENENFLYSRYAVCLIEGTEPDATVKGSEIEGAQGEDNQHMTYHLFDCTRANGGWVIALWQYPDQSASLRVGYLDAWSQQISSRPESFTLYEKIAIERLWVARNRKLDCLAEAPSQATDEEPEGPRMSEASTRAQETVKTGVDDSAGNESRTPSGGDNMTAWQTIGEVRDKRAATLAEINLAADSYHINIANAARQLDSEGAGGWRYSTQYLSGATVWQSPDGQTTRMIPRVIA